MGTLDGNKIKNGGTRWISRWQPENLAQYHKSILKMGFAAATPTSMGHVFLRSSHHHQKDVILGSCMRKETWGFNLYLPKLKYQSRISFCWKNESIDFDERTSPNEVKELWTNFLFLLFGSISCCICFVSSQFV